MRAFLFFLAVGVAFAPDAAIGRAVYGYHDLRHHHDPWRAWAAEVWRSGEVPWWAPGAGNGFPLLAEGEGGFLYPPTMLAYVLLPDGLALAWSVLGHQVLAAMGVWALARAGGPRGALRGAGGLRGAGPLVAGVAYGWSGFLISHTEYLGMQNAAAWLPWALVGTVTGRRGLVALAIGMMGLAGHPQAAAFGGLLCGLHAIANRRLAWWLPLAAWGALIASPQLLATLELSAFSLREGGVSAGFANVGALPLPELIKAVLPYAFGFDRPADIVQTYYHRGDGYWGPGVNAWETTFYLGIPVVLLALAGARRARGWAAVAVLALLLMLGGPLWELVRQLPGFGGFRFPARFGLWLTLAVALMAGQGVEALRTARRPGPFRRRTLILAALFPLATGLAFWGLNAQKTNIVAIGTAFFEGQLDAPVPPPPESPLLAAALPPVEPEIADRIPAKVRRIYADLRSSASPTSARVLWPLALLLASAATARRPRLLLAVVAVDLLAFGHDFNPRVPVGETRSPPGWLAEGMTEPGGPRLTVLDRRVDSALDAEVLSASLGLLYGTSDVILPSPLLMVRNEAMLAVAGLDVGDRGAVKVRRYLANIDIARRMGARWITTTHDVPGLVPLVRGAVRVYTDPGALPRARMVPCVEAATDGDDAFVRVRKADPRTTVVVEGGTPGCAEGTGGAEILAYANTAVSVRATGPGTLVLADTWYPGWTATVDGEPAEIARADVLFRAVSIEAGTHLVDFAYDPGRAGWALLGGVVALAGAVAAAARDRLDRR